MELVTKPPATIDVVIRAPNRIIDQITPTNVVAKLDLEKATVIQEEYPLYETMISVPSGAEVIKVSPNKVNLRLEKTREIMLDVEPNIIGKLAAGLKIEKIEVTPPRVKVIGAESKIRDRDKVRTSPIDISDLTETSEFQADLILPNPDLRLASSPTNVKIKITIQGKDAEE
jgi:YbbR domain-containing protein